MHLANKALLTTKAANEDGCLEEVITLKKQHQQVCLQVLPLPLSR